MLLATLKGEERYCFAWDEADRALLLRTLGRFAADPELSFTWADVHQLAAASLRAMAKPAADGSNAHGAESAPGPGESWENPRGERAE